MYCVPSSRSKARLVIMQFRAASAYVLGQFALVRHFHNSRVSVNSTKAASHGKLTCQQLEETGPQRPHVLGWQVDSAARLALW